MSDTSALTLQFLAWLAEGPRTYGQVMEAWRTTCPRLTVWEDAQAAGLIELQRRPAQQESVVSLTPRGMAMLESAHSR